MTTVSSQVTTEFPVTAESSNYIDCITEKALLPML